MFKQIIIFALLFHLSWAALDEESHKEKYHDCDSKIFCYGDLLRTMQLSKVNENDPEKFVNSKTKIPPDDVWNKFIDLKEKTKDKDLVDDDKALKTFFEENFDEDSLQTSEPIDYKERENLENMITDKTYQEFYQKINPTWKSLGVKTKNRLPEEDPDSYSMIALPHPFIKTGNSESLPELWQNYLIVRGLLWNDMFDSALNIIRNLVHLSEERKFVPLTNRVYAVKRRQLPLLSFMVDDYIQANLKVDKYYDIKPFLQEVYPAMENELNWWIDNAVALVKKTDKEIDYLLFKYTAYGDEPRPKQYKEDNDIGEKLPNDKEKIRFYSAVRALEETAFGYSSRYLQSENHREKYSNLEVDRFVPVELNSVLQRCARILSDWLFRIGKVEWAKYLKLSENIQSGINMILWSDEHNMWLDYDLQKRKHVNSFYITNMLPLFTLSYDADHHDHAPFVLDYLERENIISLENDSKYKFNFRAIPTSNYESGEISDKPYGSIFWNLLIIDGLKQTENAKATDLAQQIAAALVKTIYEEYDNHTTLFENYRIDGDIKDDEIEKLKKGSSSTLGVLEILLRWYGLNLEYPVGVKPIESGGLSDMHMSEAASEYDMSTSVTENIDFSWGRKRGLDTSTAKGEDNPDLTTQGTSKVKKMKQEDEPEQKKEDEIEK